MKKKYRCPKCDGDGYVLDKAATVFTLGMAPVMDWLIGGKDRDKISKDICPKCAGRGYVVYNDEI